MEKRLLNNNLFIFFVVLLFIFVLFSFSLSGQSIFSFDRDTKIDGVLAVTVEDYFDEGYSRSIYYIQIA